MSDITPEQIREWDRLLRDNGSVDTTEGGYKLSIVLAIIRRLHGLGVDKTDLNGERAWREVHAALRT